MEKLQYIIQKHGLPVKLAVLIPITGILVVAQEYAPMGILRGKLEAIGKESTGEIQVRADDRLLTCQYDASSWIELEGHRSKPSGLAVGDSVEVVADRRASMPCYARTIRVVSNKPVPIHPISNVYTRSRPIQPVVEAWSPRGSLTFSGVVLRSNPELLIIRARDGKQLNFVLRQDTRYADSGLSATLEQLRPNTRVFIRAGRNIDQEVEAYQVVWGSINGP